MTFPLYLDEDSSDRDLADALRRAGIDVARTFDLGMRGRSDSDQLRRATEEGRAILTANRGHFTALHWRWMAEGRSHGGIVIVVQQQFSIGQLVAGILALEAQRSQEQMRSALEWLADWL